MKYKGIATPEPSKGLTFEGCELLVVPDQSMTLEEILRRFTRGEALPIGQQVSNVEPEDNPLDMDLEKLAYADLTEKAEASAKLVDIQNRYEKQEKSREARERAQKAEADKAAFEKRVDDEAEKRVKKRSDRPQA